MRQVCTFGQACLSLRHSTKYHVLAQMSVWVPFMRTTKALASMHICTGSPEPSTRIAICVSFISVGNPGDHLIQNANFVYEKPLIQVKIFEISLVIPNGFYSNKKRRRTQNRAFQAVRERILDLIWFLQSFKSSFAYEIISTNLDENLDFIRFTGI